MQQIDSRHAIDQLVIWAMAEARRRGAVAELDLEGLAIDGAEDGVRSEQSRTAS